MIVCDSQVFGYVDSCCAERHRFDFIFNSFRKVQGEFRNNSFEGAMQSIVLKHGDTVLISEGCTHHRQCGGYRHRQAARLAEKYTGKELNFRFTSGGEFPKGYFGDCSGCSLWRMYA